MDTAQDGTPPKLPPCCPSGGGLRRKREDDEYEDPRGGEGDAQKGSHTTTLPSHNNNGGTSAPSCETRRDPDRSKKGNNGSKNKPAAPPSPKKTESLQQQSNDESNDSAVIPDQQYRFSSSTLLPERSIISSFAHSPYARGPGCGLHRESSAADLTDLAVDPAAAGSRENIPPPYRSSFFNEARRVQRFQDSSGDGVADWTPQEGGGSSTAAGTALLGIDRRRLQAQRRMPHQHAHAQLHDRTSNFAPPASAMLFSRASGQSHGGPHLRGAGELQSPSWVAAAPPPHRQHPTYAVPPYSTSNSAGVPHNDDFMHQGGMAMRWGQSADEDERWMLDAMNANASESVVTHHSGNNVLVLRELAVLQASYAELQRQYGQKCGEVIVLQNTVAVLREQLQEVESAKYTPTCAQTCTSHACTVAARSPFGQGGETYPRGNRSKYRRERTPSPDVRRNGHGDEYPHPPVDAQAVEAKIHSDVTSEKHSPDHSTSDHLASAANNTNRSASLSSGHPPPPAAATTVRTSSSGAVLFCGLCQISVNSDTTLRAHLQGERHRKALHRAAVNTPRCSSVIPAGIEANEPAESAPANVPV